MKVVLVTINGRPVSVGAGRYCFSLNNGVLEHNEAQKIGSEVKGESDAYADAYELASFAWQIKEFDSEEKH
jgi:hypothetical protein